MTDHQVTILAAATSSGLPVLAVFLGILSNNRQIDGLRREMETRFERLEGVMVAKFEALDAKFAAVYAKFDAAHQELLRVEQVMDARVKHLEDR